jgi:tetratricopeptide (TPR) repeat protein
VGDGTTLADELASAREVGDGVPALEILERMLGALRGVGALHRSGIVHLDLKPANILIAEDGRLCVTDFGLARIQGDTNMTRSYQVLGTPAYMSPELARGERRAASKASDVFSLGAVLFEAVTLRRPFRGTSAAEVMHSILNDEPSRLSGSLRGMNHSQVRGLGEVVARALEKQPDRRYGDAGALADDLQRVLNGEASEGLRPWRKLALAAQRNRSALKVLGVATILSVVGFLLALYQSEQRALTASALSTSSDLVNLLGEKPLAAPGLDEAEVLAQLQILVTEGSIGDVQLRGKVLGAMAGLLCDRGLEMEALGVIEGALDLLGEESPEQRASLYLVQALCHDRRGAEREAASSALMALELFEESGTDRDLEYAALARAWAWSNLWLLGRDDEREALEGDPSRYLADLERMADRARARGQQSWAAWVDLKRMHLETRGVEFHSEMLGPVHDVRTTFERMLGTDHPWTLQALYFQANLQFRLKQIEDSDASWAILVERSLRVAPEGHPLLGFALCGRAQAARELGQLELANDLYVQSLKVLESSLPPSNRKLRRITIGQGVTLTRSGRLEDAVTVYRRSLQLGEKHLESNDHVLMYLRRGLGQALLELGQLDDLEGLLHATWAGLLPDVPEVLAGIAVDEMEHTVSILVALGADGELVERVLGYLNQLDASVPDQEGLSKLRAQLESMR